MASDIDFSKHRGLLLHLAHRVQRRIYGAGSQSTQFDDIFQELSVAWCIARRDYDQSTGVPFGAYLATGIRNHINRWADKEIFAHGWNHVDLDAPLDLEGDFDAHSVTPDSQDDAFDIVARNDVAQQNLECLSANARKFVQLLESPPEPLINILKAQQAKKNYAKERGLPPGFFFKKLTMALVFEVMGVSLRERAAIMNEVRLIVNLEQLADA